MHVISRSIMPWLLVAGCATGPMSAADHERRAQSYELTARSIVGRCAIHREQELTVVDPFPCWKAEDIRFLQANLDAAEKERSAAAAIRAAEASQSASR